MIALTTPYLWYTTRATGMVTLILFTLVVALGTLVANRSGGTVVGRFELNELHRSATMVAMVFLAIHVTTTVIDSFAPTGWLSILVPFTSQYRRAGVAVGAIALDLILAVWVSSMLKVRVKNSSWRIIHWFSWLAFLSAIVHALATGTDAKSGAGLVIVVTCALTVVAAALWRFFARPHRALGRTALSPLAVSRRTSASDVASHPVGAPGWREPRTASVAPGSPFPRSSSPRNMKKRRP